MAIPKELWRMVDYMLHYGCESAGLWTDKGVEGEDAVIRDMLDEGRPFEGIEYGSERAMSLVCTRWPTVCWTGSVRCSRR